MDKIRVTAVSYLNTLPFVHGMQNIPDQDVFDISLDVPSKCAQKILEGKADIGLVPAGILPLPGNNFRMMDYCIAADGAVSSVLLVSKVPCHEIRKIYLDSDSRTSVLLVRILAERLWNIAPEWIANKTIAEEETPESMVVIGDKAFRFSFMYPYVYDLSDAWKQLTGLPFVFAVWVADRHVDLQRLRQLESALGYGITHIEDAIRHHKSILAADVDLKKYLTKHIHFRLEDPYRRGLELYLEYKSGLQVL